MDSLSATLFCSIRNDTELDEMDRITCKLMNMHPMNPNSDVERLYIPKKEEGKGLMSAEEVVLLAVLFMLIFLMNYF